MAGGWPVTEHGPVADDGGCDGESSLDRLLATAAVIVVAGPGGVGKTTISAALGVRAARRHDRRVLVVTVDPARRLADALGVAGLPGEAVLVPVGSGDGRLWVQMVEMAQAWNRIVDECAPDRATAEALLANPLYRSLTTRFVASHDYVALDRLAELNERGPEGIGFDLLVVDTPPGEHAVDVFDAPARLETFFASRLLRWLTIGSGGRLSAMAARPFLAVAERLLGSDFLTKITEFFTLFAELRPGLLARIRRVERQLHHPDTRVVVITTSERWALGTARRLLDDVVERGLNPTMLALNRVWPSTAVRTEVGDGSGDQGWQTVTVRSTIAADDLASIDDPILRQAMAAVVDQIADAEVRLPRPLRTVVVDWRAAGVTGLEDLGSLLDQCREV